jgi:hypothetical protein
MIKRRLDTPTPRTGKLLSNHMRMWPREIFDREDVIATRNDKKLPELAKPGVYVLYRDDVPHYVGQAKDLMRGRISQHATEPTQRRYHLWNYFSAFVIENADHRSDVEAILIAAMPTANSANPKLPKERTPEAVRKLFCELRAKRAFAPLTRA